MRRHPAVLLLLLLPSLLVATERAGAFIKAEVSSREIAFNQRVRISFWTPKVQLPEVDITATVRAALDLPEAQRHWRIVREPTISIHERMGTVDVAFALQPRLSGTLPLPTIPIRWLEGKQLADMGSVEVSDSIRIGDKELPLPLELSAVAGFAWNTPVSSLRERIGVAKTEEDEQAERVVFKPDPFHEIECRKGHMYALHIRNPDVALRDARAQLVGRWGEPVVDHFLDEGEPSMTWVLGWLRITASETRINAAPQLTITLVREDVAEKITADKLDSGLFRILDGR